LFEQKNSANAFPIKVVFMNVEVDMPFPIQAMFVVPKRNFKKAHDRNKIRRRMREAYRLNKNSVYAEFKPEDKKMAIAFIYTGKEEKDYLTIETSIKKLLVAIVDNKKK
jgi:ribonuclease P protein component